jgi:SAM-dependent methyltransferase
MSTNLRSDYDAWHERVFQLEPAHDDAVTPWYSLVREYLGDVAGLCVLEVACSRGGFVDVLKTAGARVTGCDFSMGALRAARHKSTGERNERGAWLVQGDLQRLPFADNTFDRVIDCETIEHVPDDQSALREMFRVTQPGGKLLLTTPNYLNLMGIYDVYSRFRHPGRVDDQPFDRRQSFVHVLRRIRSAGWSILHTDETVHQFPVIPHHNPWRWEGLEASHTIRKLLSPLALHYFVLAKKTEENGPVLTNGSSCKPA